jgi:hypothetical protein
VHTTPAQLTVSMPHSGSTVIRIRWSRFLDVDNGGRLERSGEWTTLHVPAAGTYRLSGHY